MSRSYLLVKEENLNKNLGKKIGVVHMNAVDGRRFLLNQYEYKGSHFFFFQEEGLDMLLPFFKCPANAGDTCWLAIQHVIEGPVMENYFDLLEEAL